MLQWSRKDHPGAVRFEFVLFWELVIGSFTSHFSSMLKEAFGLDYFQNFFQLWQSGILRMNLTIFDTIKTNPELGVIFFNLFCKFFLPIVEIFLVLGPKHFIYATSNKWNWHGNSKMAFYVVLKYLISEDEGEANVDTCGGDGLWTHTGSRGKQYRKAVHSILIEKPFSQ